MARRAPRQPRGNSALSDEQVRAAVDYMVALVTKLSENNMTPKQISPVQSTWESVLPVSGGGDDLLRQLFAADPSRDRCLKAIWRTEGQADKMIGIAVNCSIISGIVPRRDLGRRHPCTASACSLRDRRCCVLGTLEQGSVLRLRLT
jgi:hypothetical protein